MQLEFRALRMGYIPISIIGVWKIASGKNQGRTDDFLVKCVKIEC